METLSLRELAHLFHFTEKDSLALICEAKGLHNALPIRFRNHFH